MIAKRMRRGKTNGNDKTESKPERFMRTIEHINFRSWSLKSAGCVALLVLVSTAASAQSQGYGICSACQLLANQIKGLQAKKQDAAEDAKKFKSASHAGQVKAMLKQIAEKQQQFKACMLSKCGGKPDLSAAFTGKATMTTTNSKASGPFKQNVSASILFYKWDHAHFGIGLSPLKVGPFDTGAGSNTTTVKGRGVGVLNPQTGAMTVTLQLHFDHSHALAGNSDLIITLSTSSGSPFDAAGKVTLNGTGKFKEGFPGDDNCTLTIEGSIAPLPRLARVAKSKNKFSRGSVATLEKFN